MRSCDILKLKTVMMFAVSSDICNELIDLWKKYHNIVSNIGLSVKYYGFLYSLQSQIIHNTKSD